MHSPLSVSRRSFAVLFGLCLAASAAPSSADVWDNDPTNADDSSATKNELFHGDVQVHDIAAQGGNPDQDWFAILSRPFSSYEVLASGFQGQLWGGASGGVLFMDRVLATGTVLDPGSPPPGGLGGSRSVRWTNNTASQVTDFIRVDGGETMCAINCTTDAQYTIRMRETTGAISRFNNSGTQSTILMLQNPTDYAITGIAYFWDAGGDTGRDAAIRPAAEGTLRDHHQHHRARRGGLHHDHPERPLRRPAGQERGPRARDGLLLRHAARVPPALARTIGPARPIDAMIDP